MRRTIQQPTAVSVSLPIPFVIVPDNIIPFRPSRHPKQVGYPDRKEPPIFRIRHHHNCRQSQRRHQPECPTSEILPL